MGKFIDFGKIFNEKRGKSFILNIVLKGEYGRSDPKECHHPILITFFLKIIKKGNDKKMVVGEEGRYLITACRDCGKIFEIKLKNYRLRANFLFLKFMVI